MPKPESFRLQPGDWFAAFSPATACTHLLVVKGTAVILEVNRCEKNPGWLTLRADVAGKAVQAGDTLTFELVSLNTSVDVDIHTVADVQRLRACLAAPERMQVRRGTKTSDTAYVNIKPEDGAAEVVIPRQSANLQMTLPLRVPHLNRNWSAGLWQKEGYVKGAYGSGENRYRGVGVDFAGSAHIPLYVDKADRTHVLVGHPVVADARGQGIAINVMHLFDHPHQWRVTVNNLTQQVVTTKLTQAMALPNLDFEAREITLRPGEFRVLRAKAPRN